MRSVSQLTGWRLAPLACALVLALPAAPVLAGLFDDEEARLQIVELRKTVAALNTRLETTSRNQLDFANQIETLRADVARLTGQIEVLTNSLESAHKRQQDFYVDLDNRLRKLEAGAMPAAPGPDAAEQKPADPQAEMKSYETALGLLREGKYKEAQAGFESFIAAYPKSAMQPNAHYWLGSSLYQQKGFQQAAAIFGKLPASWPNDPKAPDALLKQADALVAAKDVPGAVRALEMLVEKYPTNPAVETARARIKTYEPKKKR